MSKHITSLPIDLKPVLEALPKGTYVHSIALRPDNSGIDIIWEHDASKTGYTYPVPYAVEKLAEKAPKVISKNRKLVEAELWPFKISVDENHH